MTLRKRRPRNIRLLAAVASAVVATSVASGAYAAPLSSSPPTASPSIPGEPGKPGTPTTHDHASHDHGPKEYMLKDGRVLRTHGPDYESTALPAGDGAGYPVLRTTTPHMECVTDSTKPKIDLVFAYPHDATPMDPGTAAYEVRRMFTSFADAYGHNVWLRFRDRLGGYAMMKFRTRCDAYGKILVWQKKLSNVSVNTEDKDVFGRIVQGLRDGTPALKNRDAKYLVLYQDNKGCGGDGRALGRGEFYDDHYRSIHNANNGEYGIGAMYGVVYNCFGTNAGKGARTMAHELWHTMGAVMYDYKSTYPEPERYPNPAPNSDGKGHCTDGEDVMCGSPGSKTGTCNIAWGGVQDIDCYENDYFAWRGTERVEYLKSHWNTGDCYNRFLSFYDNGRRLCTTQYSRYPDKYQR